MEGSAHVQTKLEDKGSSLSSVTKCVFEPELNLYRIVAHKGKVVSHYGVSFNPNIKVDKCGIISDNESTETFNYLFFEEALYLTQRGLLQVYDADGQLLTAKDLFKCFENNCSSQIIIEAYLSYMHLRGQGYIVFRHGLLTDSSYNVHELNTPGDDVETKKMAVKVRALKRKEASLRAASQPPQILNSEKEPKIAFDVFKPNSHFAKTKVSSPEYMVAVTNYNSPIDMSSLNILLRQKRGSNLRIAAVSESGTIVMLGLCDKEVVPIIQPITENV